MCARHGGRVTALTVTVLSPVKVKCAPFAHSPMAAQHITSTGPTAHFMHTGSNAKPDVSATRRLLARGMFYPPP